MNLFVRITYQSIIITCWILSIKYLAALKLNRLIIDAPVKNGTSTWLHCDFVLDDSEKRAFTTKFYKNNIEFYRYSVSSDRLKPTKKFFIQPAIHVNMNRSNGTHVFLEHIESSTEGTFSCEINTDEPFFMSMQAQQDLRVYILPKKRLQLINLKNNYKEGDLVNIQCKSSPSKPPIVIRWHINNQQIHKNEENLNITYQTLEQDSINGYSSSSSNLTFIFHLCNYNTSYYYYNNNNLRTNRTRKTCLRRGRIGQLLRQTSSGLTIRCTGVLSQIMDETYEELVIEEKGQHSRYEQSANSQLLKTPKIEGNLRSQIGDQLILNCSSGDYSPAPYLEWFVNNRRINEQYVHNYVTVQSMAESYNVSANSMSYSAPYTDIQSNDDPKFKSIKQQISTTYNGQHLHEQRSTEKQNLHSKTFLPKSTHSNRSLVYRKNGDSTYRQQSNSTNVIQKVRSHDVINRDKDQDFQNDYLFSNNLKKLNLLSIQQRNKNNNNSFPLINTTMHDTVIGQALQSDSDLTLSLLNQSDLNSFVNSFPQQILYNNNVNLTQLQNIIYQHYADYSFRTGQQHRIGIRFRVMKKHYQTLDYALRVKCVATYGKILWQDQTTIALFGDGRVNQHYEALNNSCTVLSYSSFLCRSVLIWIIHLINNGLIKNLKIF